MLTMISHVITGAADLGAAFLLMFGLKRMSSPVTARSGIRVAGVGMLVAVLACFLNVVGRQRRRPAASHRQYRPCCRHAHHRRWPRMVEGQNGEAHRHAPDGGAL